MLNIFVHCPSHQEFDDSCIECLRLQLKDREDQLGLLYNLAEVESDLIRTLRSRQRFMQSWIERARGILSRGREAMAVKPGMEQAIWNIDGILEAEFTLGPDLLARAILFEFPGGITIERLDHNKYAVKKGTGALAPQLYLMKSGTFGITSGEMMIFPNPEACFLYLKAHNFILQDEANERIG